MRYVLAALIVAVLVLVWRQRRDEASAAMPGEAARAEAEDDAIDHAALEAAEREVRNLDTDIAGRPLDEQAGDDWGPGTPKGLHGG